MEPDCPEASIGRALFGLSSVSQEVNREALRAAVSRQMFCSMQDCGRVLDVRRARYVAFQTSTPNGQQRAGVVLCGDCLERVRELHDKARDALVRRGYLVVASDAERAAHAAQLNIPGMADGRPICVLSIAEDIDARDLYTPKGNVRTSKPRARRARKGVRNV